MATLTLRGRLKSSSVICALVLAAFPQGAAADEASARPERVVPLTTRFVLNGTILDYGLEGVLSHGVLAASERETVPQSDMTFALSQDLVEDVNGALFQRRQSAWYGQLRTRSSEEVITTRLREAVDLAGSRTNLTITGRCLFGEADPHAFCTYTPGVAVDDADINTDTLMPDRFVFESDFGGVIRQDTHEALKAPGFQRGVAGSDEAVGLALDLPNSGFTYAQDRADRNGIERRMESDSQLILSFSELDQNLFSNDTGASLDRTVRSVVLLNEKDRSWNAVAVQALSWLLPAANGRLAQGREAPNLGISNNLFYAANNTRLPADSFTTYHSSLSWVTHSDTPPRTAAETPVAWSNSLWLGFSPVREIRHSTELRYEATGARETTSSTFREGGLTSDLAGRITLVDALTEALTQFQLSAIRELYVQTGSAITTQDAIRHVTFREKHEHSYAPHLSF